MIMGQDTRVIKAAIFDMDGVLIDNVEYHLEAFVKFGAEQGRNLTEADIRSVFGRKNSDMLQVLLQRRLTTEEINRFAIRKEELYRELIAPDFQQRVVPGLLEFFNLLRQEEEFGIALATSGPIDNVEFVLSELGLQEGFDAIITGDQVTHGKPHPEAFLLAAERLDREAQECVVFEDSVSGLQAALNAGCKCIALETTHPREELEPIGPHQIIRDFRGLRPRDLQGLC
jgi:beta-phosphoglucomutase family hydrolase